MGLETGVVYIGDLVSTNPTGTDPKGQGDDHIRNTKKAAKQSFAGFTGAIMVTGPESGAANAYVLTPVPALPTYVAGMTVTFLAGNANTGAATLNISGLGVKALKGTTGDELLANEIATTGYVSAIYDGTRFLLKAPSKEWVEQLALSGVLPGMTGNAGKFLTTADGISASWGFAGISGYLAKTANYTVLTTDREKLIEVTATSSIALTLPSVVTAAAQFGFWAMNSGSGTVTLTPVGSDTITVASLRPGETALLFNDGVSAWRVWIANSTGVEDLMLFGDASDGNVTVAGPVTLDRDMHYATLTLASGAVITPKGYRIFCRVLDATNAPAGAISWDGVAGNSAVTFVGGAAVTRLLAGADAPVGGGSSNGPAGSNGVGGTPGTAGASAANPYSIGGTGGGAGGGGAGASGAGGGGGSGGANSTATPRRLTAEFPPLPTTESASALSKLYGGGAGGSGASGGGGAGTTSGGGGSGAAGAGVILLFAKTIIRGASTAVGAIRAKGAPGGGGGGGDVNSGGGGGGGGSGGGWVYLVYRTLVGALGTGMFDVTGGNGGPGGNTTGTGAGGVGGSSGQGGRVQAFNVTTGALTELAPAASVAGAANSGTTGGNGGAATTSRVSL